MIAVHLHAVAKTYHLDAVGVAALQDINLEVRAGLLTVICGASGSGKTTLLNLIGGLDRPDAGRIHVASHDIVSMDDDQLSDFRARHLGVVFQNFNLLPVLNAEENVEYPLVMLGMDKAERKKRAAEMLAAVGLTEQARRRPGELSGGQRQRVAIARALAARPQLVLADEPTANLDSQTGASIIELMRRLQREQQVSFVISSHDPQVLAAADDMVRIKDGRIVEVRRADALKVAA